MNKAKQERTKSTKVLGCLLLAAAIGTYYIGNSHDRTASSESINSAVQQKPIVTKIQKQTPEVISDSREQYKIKTGDSIWSISNKVKPDNVELIPYTLVLKEINSSIKFQPGAMLDIPNKHDLKKITLPNIEIKFNTRDKEIIQYIKEAEGSIEIQKNIKRKLLDGSSGSTFKKGRFYPYKDSRGNWSIGYGHYISKNRSQAMKYAKGLSIREADELLHKDMERVYEEYVLLLQRKGVTDLPVSIQKALYELTFNLGSGSLSQFNNMWKSLKKGNYQRAMNEMKRSNWSKQVQKERVERITGAFKEHIITA